MCCWKACPCTCLHGRSEPTSLSVCSLPSVSVVALAALTGSFYIGVLLMLPVLHIPLKWTAQLFPDKTLRKLNKVGNIVPLC